jgi:hypothetical protein
VDLAVEEHPARAIHPFIWIFVIAVRLLCDEKLNSETT